MFMARIARWCVPYRNPSLYMKTLNTICSPWYISEEHNCFKKLQAGAENRSIYWLKYTEIFMTILQHHAVSGQMILSPCSWPRGQPWPCRCCWRWALRCSGWTCRPAPRSRSRASRTRTRCRRPGFEWRPPARRFKIMVMNRWANRLTVKKRDDILF